MQTSARNHFNGTVTSHRAGAVNDQVELDIDGSHRIVAIITRESNESLGLDVGAKAFALVKASSVIVATDLSGGKLSARNQLHGKVASVTPGAVNAEVVIDLGGGLQIAAVVTRSSAEALKLAPGKPAIAIFKATSVIVGTMG